MFLCLSARSFSFLCFLHKHSHNRRYNTRLRRWWLCFVTFSLSVALRSRIILLLNCFRFVTLTMGVFQLLYICTGAGASFIHFHLPRYVNIAKWYFDATQVCSRISIIWPEWDQKRTAAIFPKAKKIFLLCIRNNYDNWKAIESLDQTWDTLKLFDLQNRALLASVLFKNGILFDCFGPLRKNPFKIFRRLCEVMLITHLRFSLIIIGHHMAARIKSDKST